MAEHIIQNALSPGCNDQGQKDFSDYAFACTKRFIEESANLALNSASSIHNKGKQYFISHKTELINEIQAEPDNDSNLLTVYHSEQPIQYYNFAGAFNPSYPRMYWTSNNQ